VLFRVAHECGANPIGIRSSDEWFVLRGARMLGPYTSVQLSRYLLLGRVRHSDQLSRDGEQWYPVVEYPDLIPDQLHNLHSSQGWKRYLDALAEIDERSVAQPQGARRRRGEQSWRRFRDEWRGALRGAGLAGDERRLIPLLLLGVTLAALLVLLALSSVATR